MNDQSSGAILVAIGGSGRGMRAVETGAALAAAFDVSWQAVFIETPRSARDRTIAERAAEALAHAAELGASVSSEPAPSVAEGLLAHLATAPAAHLVMGAPSGLWRRRRPLASSFLRTLLARRPELTVHIAPADKARKSFRYAPDPSTSASRPRHYVIAVALVLATLAACKLLSIATGGRPLSLLFLFPVIAIAARFGLKPALAAVAASVFSYDFFLRAPMFHFELLAPVNVVLLIALGAVAIYTSAITGALRSRAALSDRSAQESARIATFAQTLSRVTSWEETAQAVCDEFAAEFGAQAIVFRAENGDLVRVAAQPADAKLGAIDRAALDWSWANGEEAGAGTHHLSAADWRFAPLTTSLGKLAVLALSRTDGRDPIRAERKVLFATLISQAALAHERLVLEDTYRARSGDGA